jgi:hypothetical protein
MDSRLSIHRLGDLPWPLFFKEGKNASLWKREVGRDLR